MKQKLWAAVLSAAMLAACAFGFAACGEGGSGNGGQNGNNTEQGGTEQGGTEQGGVEQGGTEQGGTEQGGAEQGGSEQGGSEIVTTVGLAYKINDDGTAYAVAGIGTATDTDIVIPSTYNGLPVTYIGSYAFESCSGLTEITIPDSVTGIGECAFYYCSGLTEITIPNSVTGIGDGAFYYCSGLESITVEAGNSVYHSSGNCLIETGSKTLITGCKNSEIPTDGSVTYIGSYAFESCSGLTEITIPDSVTGIGDGAFFECSGLESVTIGNGVTGIGERAFADCDGLTEITIPDSVTSIGGWAFADCRGLTIYCEADSQPSEWDSTWNSDYMDVTRDCPVVWNCNNSNVADDGYIYAVIGGIRYALKSDIATVARQTTTLSGAISVLESVTYQGLSYSVTRIGDGAFEDCSGLTDITIPDSVTSIGVAAFADCDGLTSVYYTGTAGEWNAVTIESFGNAALTNATRYYYIENEADVPDDGSNYWHFDTDGVTPVVWETPSVTS